MMNEEDYLNSKMGKRNPFTVPEGYFEQLTSQVMQKLPEAKAEKPALIKRLRPWLYAAACVCVGVFIAAVAFNNNNEEVRKQMRIATAEQKSVESYYSDSYYEDEANYAMVDNQDIYAYLLAEM
ncbi:MAG: hypothetical protein IKM76_10120 [Prevotella sp.]|jgi:hypothetical protein|nr:hypothetical protein [Prevotella sp.]MBR3066394.1 hypothetical protein [Prevotella sp.]MBR6828487.1 hypothetical protein [Prevotella sp.]